MAKETKKKPAQAAAKGAPGKSGVISALHPAETRPSDAGKPSAKTGGKSASGKTGR
jgi:hypothetical protein